MSPWSRADLDESSDRELFARRARALGRAHVPSLSAVLGEADGRRARAARRQRLAIAFGVAAACVAAVVWLPRAHAPEATRDARAVAAPSAPTAEPSDPSLDTSAWAMPWSSAELTYASIDVPACVQQPPSLSVVDEPSALVCEPVLASSIAGP